jgi:hypothetical protein
MSVSVYTTTDFENIEQEGFQFKIPDETTNIISLLSEQVGAPSYIKTPTFIKNSYKEKRKKKKQNELSDEDWEVLRDFQTTKLEKDEGLDKITNQICKFLNKITTTRYQIHCEAIIGLIREIPEDEFTEEIKMKIGSSIFNIASGNSLFSESYALLYKDLLCEFEFMNSIFKKNVDEYIELFTNIQYVNPQEDYNLFCEINKTNDQRKAIGKFYSNLMNIGILESEKIIDIINYFQDNIKKNMNDCEKINENEEMSENIYIILQCGYVTLKDLEIWDSIYKNVEFISQAQPKKCAGLSNKVLFKHMDLLEELN